MFFDDGAYSGMQVISVFQELMGVPLEERLTNEHHMDELAQQEKDKLKESNIFLVYIFFNKNSEDYIKNQLKKLDLNNVKILYSVDLSKKIIDDNTIFKDENQKDLVKEYLSIIGKNIILSKKTEENGKIKNGWSKKRIDEAALGYNDAQQMVVYSTNIPTFSISAFWNSGKFEEHDWNLLFQRTDKDKNINN